MKVKLFILLIPFLLCSCQNVDSKLESSNISSSETTIHHISENINTPDYENVNIKIKEYFKYFKADCTSDAMNIDQKSDRILKETVDTPQWSAEGGELTTYKKDGKIIRRECILYGESGRRETNCYYISETETYITDLSIEYTTYGLQSEFTDILSYSFNEYWRDVDMFKMSVSLNIIAPSENYQDFANYVEQIEGV